MEQAFGNPDGARADLDELRKEFIGFNNDQYNQFGGLATRENDLRARIFAGKKGAGKTVYLRRLHEWCSHKDDLLATDIENDTIPTIHVVAACRTLRRFEVTTKWTQIWRRATIRTLAALFLSNYGLLKDTLSADFKAAIIKSHKRQLSIPQTPVSVTSQVVGILKEYGGTSASLTSYLDDSQWEEIEYFISEALKISPPICLFIDAIDDEFKHAPMEWHRCQKGLFYSVMDFLKNSRFGGRLHIFIGIRDIVYSSVLQGEHATKYVDDPYIRNLTWDKHAIKTLITEKLRSLHKKRGGNGPPPTTFSQWIGMEKIHVNSRGVDECIDEYLLRHTRLIPRDVIILGNKIAPIVSRFHHDKDLNVFINNLKMNVKSISEKFGEEQLEICANHLASMNSTTNQSARNETAYFTASKEYVRGIRSDLKRLISDIGSEKFSLSKMQEVSENLINYNFSDSDVFSVLWQHGMISMLENDMQNSENSIERRFMNSGDSSFKIPQRNVPFMFHSSLIDITEISVQKGNARS